MVPQISIIVAAWNAEEYLPRSLDSIVRQSFCDWEVIVVDDGSTDNTGVIADGYSNKDARIRVIHQDHGGLAKARQTGLDAAVGVFSIFADADDWMEEDMLELMFLQARQTASDVVICDYIEENGMGSFYRKQEPAGNYSRDVLPQMLWQMHGSLCNKLIKRSLYSDYGIRFVPDISYCDDECVVIPIFAQNVPLSYVGKGLYHYDKNANPVSDSNVWKNRKVEEYQRYLDRIEPYFRNPDLRNNYNNKVANIIYRLTYAPKEYYPETRSFYRKYKHSLIVSTLPVKKKLFCILFFRGFRLLVGIRTDKPA